MSVSAARAHAGLGGHFVVHAPATAAALRMACGDELCAGGAVEAVYTLLAMRDGIVPPTLNLDNPSEGCDINLVPHTAQERKVTTALSNSFGFGGTNASLIFRALN